MDIQYGNLDALRWLWLLPLCVATTVFALNATRRARRRFASANLLDRLLPTTSVARLVGSTSIVAASIALMVIALVDIRWGKIWREVPQKGIEVMFVLDVSRSMLAEDTTPNRLSRAKQQIKDTLSEMAGDRVGLVVFAGDARQQIPLTSHYDDFRQSLDAVGPHSVRRGGSRLGDAIEAAAGSFLDNTNDHKAMVILTDGEDHESEPLKAAARAHEEMGIRIFTVGLGDMTTGARIPNQSDLGAQYVQYEGQQVWSKLNGEILKEIAIATDGAYIPAGTKHVNMADVYHGYIADVEQQEFEIARISNYEARFQWFLAVALLLLLTDVALTTSPGWKRNSRPESARLTASGGQAEVQPAAPQDSVAA